MPPAPSNLDITSGLTSDQRRARIIKWSGVDLVIDVGANAGQYARAVRSQGYSGRIVSLEPLAGAYADLAASTGSDPLWDCHQVGLGSEDGHAIMNVSENTVCSSLLPMDARTVALEPDAKYVGTEEVRLARLDTLWSEITRGAERPYLKVDVQGYELEVLRGAQSALAEIRVVQAELSLAALYPGAPLLAEVVNYLHTHAFRVISLDCVFDDPTTGEMLQLDGIFARPPSEKCNAPPGP